MDFLTLARERYSVRAFSDKPIEPEKMERILEAGRLAPTACNNQPQRIYVLKSQEALTKINSLSRCIFGAPVVLLFAYDTAREWNSPLEAGIHAGDQDVSIVATHMMLEAWELGIGSCWVNLFPNTKTAEAFGLPDTVRPVLLMPIGYAAEGAKPAPRHFQSKDLTELVTEL